MGEYDELERWRLEAALDKANQELIGHYHILNALNRYLIALETGPSVSRDALQELQATYAAVMRDRYPDPRP